MNMEQLFLPVFDQDLSLRARYDSVHGQKVKALIFTYIVLA